MKEKEILKNKIPWWIIAILIILVIILLNTSDNLEDYTNCVDDCVYDVYDCMYSYEVWDSQGNSYIEYWGADYCISELEYCTTICEIDYGN